MWTVLLFQGYIDDMIQDIVDSITWVIDNIHDYGGDKVSTCDSFTFII